ncbi:MAG: hypothetical protein WAV00_05245 [Nocardioides sp.]
MVHLPPRRTPRTWLRAHFTVLPRDIDGWNDLTDRMQPPIEVLHHFLGLHTEVRSEHLPLLWEAFLQWVRVHGRFDEWWWPGTPAPSSRLCQPSLAVDDLWRLLAAGTITWRELPEHVQVMERVPVREPRSRTNLYETYTKAYYDEYGPPLPLLFRIDELLGLYGGRLYRAECIKDPVKSWGVSICPEESDAGRDPEPGRTCLHKIPWVAIEVSGGTG